MGEQNVGEQGHEPGELELEPQPMLFSTSARGA